MLALKIIITLITFGTIKAMPLISNLRTNTSYFCNNTNETQTNIDYDNNTFLFFLNNENMYCEYNKSSAMTEITCIINRIDEICSTSTSIPYAYKTFSFNSIQKQSMKKNLFEKERIEIPKLLKNAYYLLPPSKNLKDKFITFFNQGKYIKCYEILTNLNNNSFKEKSSINFFRYLNYTSKIHIINTVDTIQSSNIKNNYDSIFFYNNKEEISNINNLESNCTGYLINVNSQKKTFMDLKGKVLINSLFTNFGNILFMPCDVLIFENWLNYSCEYHFEFLNIIIEFVPFIKPLYIYWFKLYEITINNNFCNKFSILKLKAFSFYILSIITLPSGSSEQKELFAYVCNVFKSTQNDSSIDKIFALMLNIHLDK